MNCSAIYQTTLQVIFVLTFLCILSSCGDHVSIYVEQGANGKLIVSSTCAGSSEINWGDGAKETDENGGYRDHVYAYNGSYKISVSCTGRYDDMFPFEPSGSTRTGVTTARDEPPSVTPFVAALAGLVTAIAALIAALRHKKPDVTK
jgi:hypothetical protein